MRRGVRQWLDRKQGLVLEGRCVRGWQRPGEYSECKEMGEEQSESESDIHASPPRKGLQ